MANPRLPGISENEQALLYAKLNEYNRGRASFKEVGVYLVVLPRPGKPNYSLWLYSPLPEKQSILYIHDLSPDINRDTFIKWSFISAMAVTGAYYDVPMGEVQKPGKIRDTFIGLSTESAALGKKLGVEFPEDPVSYNLKVIDKLDPESTASMQKDLARGHDSEIQGLLFDMIAAAEEQGINIPTYRMVAEKFKKSDH